MPKIRNLGTLTVSSYCNAGIVGWDDLHDLTFCLKLARPIPVDDEKDSDWYWFQIAADGTWEISDSFKNDSIDSLFTVQKILSSVPGNVFKLCARLATYCDEGYFREEYGCAPYVTIGTDDGCLEVNLIRDPVRDLSKFLDAVSRKMSNWWRDIDRS